MIFAEWVSCLISPLCKIYLLNRVNRKKFLLPIPSSIHRIICFIDKNSLVAPNKKIKESTFVEDKHPFFSVWPIAVTLRSTVIKVDLNYRIIGHTLQKHGFSKIDLTFVKKHLYVVGNIIICVQNQDSPQAIAILKHQCHLEAGFAFQKNCPSS